MPVYSEPLPEVSPPDPPVPHPTKHWYDDHDFYGEMTQDDDLPLGTGISYRFAYSKPTVTHDQNGYHIDFDNAVITIPNSGDPTLTTEDIFECVIKIGNNEFHLGG